MMASLTRVLHRVSLRGRSLGAMSWRYQTSFKPAVLPSLSSKSFLEGPLAWKRQQFIEFHISQCKWEAHEVEQREEYCMSLDKFKKAVENDEVLVVDVRRRDEVEQGRVPAKRYIHVPVKEIEDALQLTDEDFEEKYGSKKPDKSASDIVFHCLAGVRSTFALRAAHNAGYTKARHFPGGWEEWSEKQGA